MAANLTRLVVVGSILYGACAALRTTTFCLSDLQCEELYPCFTTHVCEQARCFVNVTADIGSFCEHVGIDVVGTCGVNGQCSLPSCSSAIASCGYGGVCQDDCHSNLAHCAALFNGEIPVNATARGCYCFDGYEGESCEGLADLVYSRGNRTRVLNSLALIEPDRELTVVDGDPWHSCPHCRNSFADGACDPLCWTEACLFDGGDCSEEVQVSCSSECMMHFQDSFCDLDCFTPACAFDGTDCGENIQSKLYRLQVTVRKSDHVDAALFQISNYLKSPIVRFDFVSATQFVVDIGPCQTADCLASYAPQGLLALLAANQSAIFQWVQPAGESLPPIQPAPAPQHQRSSQASSGLSHGVLLAVVCAASIVFILIIGAIIQAGKRSVLPTSGTGSPSAKRPRRTGIDASQDFDVQNFDTISRMTELTETSFDLSTAQTSWAQRLRDSGSLPTGSPPTLAASDTCVTIPGSPDSDATESGSISTCDKSEFSSANDHVSRIAPMHSFPDPWMNGACNEPSASIRTEDSGITSIGSSESYSRNSMTIAQNSNNVINAKLRKANTKNPVEKLQQQWLIFAFEGKLDGLRKLALKDKRHANCRDIEGRCPLHFACFGKHLHVIRFLVEEVGAFVDGVAPGWNGQSPLHAASALGWVTGVEYLLQAGADPNLRDGAGVTPLMECVKVHSMDTVLVYLRSARRALRDPENADNIAMSPKFKKLPLAVQFLKRLDSGERLSFTVVECPDNKGWTALHYAAALDNVKACLFLIRHGAQVDSVTTAGETALHLAARENHETVIRSLLNNNARIDVLDNRNRRPVDLLSPDSRPSIREALQMVALKTKNES